MEGSSDGCVHVFQESTAASLLGAVKRDGSRWLGCQSPHHIRTIDQSQKFY